MPKSERRALIGLHLLLAVYSLSDVCSKPLRALLL